MDKHLSKVHSEATLASAGGASVVWVGRSGRSPAVAFAVLAAAILWGVAIQAGLLPISPQAGVVVAGALVLVFSAIVALAETGRLPVHMVFDGQALHLSQRLCLRRRTVVLPAQLEAGAAWEKWMTGQRVGDDVYWTRHGDRRVGGYLRIFSGSHSITVFASGTSVTEYWSDKGLRRGPRRFRCDIRMDAAAFVSLAYLLSSRGMLSPK